MTCSVTTVHLLSNGTLLCDQPPNFADMVATSTFKHGYLLFSRGRRPQISLLFCVNITVQWSLYIGQIREVILYFNWSITNKFSMVTFS